MLDLHLWRSVDASVPPAEEGMAGQVNTEQDRLGKAVTLPQHLTSSTGLDPVFCQFCTSSEAREIQDTEQESLGQIPLTLIKVYV